MKQQGVGRADQVNRRVTYSDPGIGVGRAAVNETGPGPMPPEMLKDMCANEVSREIPSIFNELTEATSCLENAFAELAARIAPALGPIETRKDNAERGASSELGRGLAQTVNRLWALRSAVIETAGAVQL